MISLSLDHHIELDEKHQKSLFAISKTDESSIQKRSQADDISTHSAFHVGKLVSGMGCEFTELWSFYTQPPHALNSY